MGYSSYTHIGPYFVFPNVKISHTGDPKPVCEKCRANADRGAKFCSQCGGPVIMASDTHEEIINLFDFDDDLTEHLMQIQENPIVVPNRQNQHSIELENRNYGATFDFATADPEAAIQWFKKECKVLTDWLAKNNHPEGTFHFGVVNYVM